MKTKILLFLAATALSPFALSAAEPAQPPGPPPAGEHGKDRPGRGDVRAELKHLAEELQLTDSQKDQVKEILKARWKAMKDLDKEDRRGAAGQKIRDESQQKIRALLTPDQQKKYDAIVEEMKDRMGKGPRGDRPPRD